MRLFFHKTIKKRQFLVLMVLYLLCAVTVISVEFCRMERERSRYTAQRREYDARLLLALEAQTHILSNDPMNVEAATAGNTLCSLSNVPLASMGRAFSCEPKIGAADWKILHEQCANGAKQMLAGETTGDVCLKAIDNTARALLPIPVETEETPAIGKAYITLTPAEARNAAYQYVGDVVKLLTEETHGDAYVFRCRNRCLMVSRANGKLLYYTEQYPHGAPMFTEEECLSVCRIYLNQTGIPVSDMPVGSAVMNGICTYRFLSPTGSEMITVSAAMDTGTVCYFNAVNTED